MRRDESHIVPLDASVQYLLLIFKTLCFIFENIRAYMRNVTFNLWSGPQESDRRLNKMVDRVGLSGALRTDLFRLQ